MARVTIHKPYLVILSIAFLILCLVFYLPAIPQNQSYHNFADQREFLSIPNFLNVLSNLPYVVVGIMGVILVSGKSKVEAGPALLHSHKYIYLIFFTAVVLVGAGSAYYHLNPSNSTLVWDRLPIAIAIISLFTIVIAEYIHHKMAKRLYLPMLLLGVFSVLYWYWSETVGQGDLRLYILVQFLPIVLIPLIVCLFKSQFSLGRYYFFMIACYIVAKAFELSDQLIFETVGTLSGHSLKHIASAVAPLLFYIALLKRI